MDVVNYKCPNCTAGLRFDSETQKMVCDYCGSIYTVDELETLYADQKEENPKSEEHTGHWDGFDPTMWQTQDMEGMQIWHCSSCGAEIIVEETTGASKCPYCDNPTIAPKQFEGMYHPDYIIPFKKSKKEALAALQNHYLNRPLLPKVFQDENHMEDLKAMYVPFWLFDGKAYGDFRFEGIRIRHYSDSEYHYTEERFYDVRRAGRMAFTKVPVDGSKAIDDTFMESIEPFDYSELEPFQISYLSGYIANKYDLEPDHLEPRVYGRMKQSVQEYFSRSDGTYASMIPRGENIRLEEKGKVSYALLPVWFLNTKWDGKDYKFVMNGQTGKFVGDLPVSGKLLKNYWLKFHLPIAAVMAAGVTALMLMGVI